MKYVPRYILSINYEKRGRTKRGVSVYDVVGGNHFFYVTTPPMSDFIQLNFVTFEVKIESLSFTPIFECPTLILCWF